MRISRSTQAIESSDAEVEGETRLNAMLSGPDFAASSRMVANAPQRETHSAQYVETRSDVVMPAATRQPRLAASIMATSIFQGQGPGRPPRATNYVAPSIPTRDLLLVTDEQGQIPFSALRDLLFASMSFPVAFPPQELRTCDAETTAEPGRCPPSEARPFQYIDGGVFDNSPLRLAVRLARTGLEEGSGGLRWRPLPDPASRTTPKTVAFAFLDPSATDYPSTPAPGPASTRDGLGREVVAIVSNLIATARSKELSILLEEEPEIADRIVSTRRRFPAASAPMLAFLGFFDREFREFDFVLGMYDATRTLERAAPVGEVHLGVGGGGRRDPGDPGWQRFDCMRAVFDGEAGSESACRSEQLGDFRALLQVSLDQLYSACRAGAGEGSRFREPHCVRAGRGQPPPRVPGLEPRKWPDWRQRPRESELAYTLRLLSAYGFHFRDLGVPPGRSDLALARIRAALGRAAGALVAAQHWSEREPIALATKIAADTVAYLPPDRMLHLTMGPTESEVGASWGSYGARWIPSGLRLTTALSFRGLAQVFSSSHGEPFALALTAGVEYVPPGSTIIAQFRLAARAGWSFAADDDWGMQPCEDRGRASASTCSRPVVQAVAGVTTLEKFRIQLAGAWYPGSPTRAQQWAFSPGIGLEFAF